MRKKPYVESQSEDESDNKARNYLTRSQQIAIIAGQNLDMILTDAQKRHLQWRKKVLGELSPETAAPTALLYAVHKDGSLTYMFHAVTFVPRWYVHGYIHQTFEHLRRHFKSRSERDISGCMICKHPKPGKEGLLAEIHLVAEGLSELTVVHEAVHAAGYLSRILDATEAKKLAAPYLSGTRSSLVWREEIQCRTVEVLTKQIVMTLHALGIPCISLREAQI
jgi:hypothetical protein